MNLRSIADGFRWISRPVEDDEEENEEMDTAHEDEKRSDRSSRSGRSDRSGRSSRSDRSTRTDRDPMEESFSTFDTGRSDQRNNKVVNIHATTQLKVLVIKPTSKSAREDIVDHLREKHTVVFNMDSLSPAERNVFLSFVAGAAYATGGQVQEVAGLTYIATPFNVNLVTDELVSELENNGFYNF